MDFQHLFLFSAVKDLPELKTMPVSAVKDLPTTKEFFLREPGICDCRHESLMAGEAEDSLRRSRIRLG